MNVYNLTPYNLGYGDSSVIRRNGHIDGVISINGVVGTGKVLRGIAKLEMGISGDINVYIRKLGNIMTDINILDNIRLNKNALSTIKSDINIIGHIILGKNIYSLASNEFEIFGDILLGKNIYALVNHEFEINGNVLLGKIISSRNECMININTLLELSAYIYDVVNINVNIPPGVELRIDSDNRTVLLGRDNVFWAYQDANGVPSAWIYMFRETDYIDIEYDVGNSLSGSIQYDERYL